MRKQNLKIKKCQRDEIPAFIHSKPDALLSIVFVRMADHSFSDQKLFLSTTYGMNNYLDAKCEFIKVQEQIFCSKFQEENIHGKQRINFQTK